MKHVLRVMMLSILVSGCGTLATLTQQEPQAAVDSSDQTVDVPENAVRLVIETVTPTADESGQPALQVSGYQNHGCDEPIEVTQTLMDTTIAVEIYQVLPPNARCPRNIIPYEAVIPLTVPLTRGAVYTIDVNGTVMEFTAP
jgi:hypothetical protein